ncbi:hypothetical protein DFJ43DRAFT_960622, partial [Lentinula guzmanii]
ALPPRRKPPKHRHATPSGPWPFLDLDDDVDPAQLTSPPPQPKFYEDEETENGHGSVLDSRPYWSHYPQSQFANWTQWQQNKSGIARLVNRRLPMLENCRIFKLDIQSDGIFRANNIRSEGGDYVVRSGRPPSEARIKVFFVDNLSGPVLQMLGTKYRIEPFFFSSSLNSIPSRYQEQVRPGKGDHITLTLSFIRTLPSPSTAPPTPTTSYADSAINEDTLHMLQSSILMQAPIIDVEAPLVLTSDPSKLAAGQTSYSFSICSLSTLSEESLSLNPSRKVYLLWTLTNHSMGARVIRSVDKIPTSRAMKRILTAVSALSFLIIYLLRLHSIRLRRRLCINVCWLQVIAYLCPYQVVRSIGRTYFSQLFLLETSRRPNVRVRTQTGPSDSESYERLLNKECTNLLNEIDRLEMTRAMLDNRLGNVMELAFSSVNIEDSRRMKNLAEVSVRDSAVMKQISYLTMIFLPASFVAAIFGMNVMEINPGSYGTVLHYLAAAIPLTVLTVWVMM